MLRHLITLIFNFVCAFAAVLPASMDAAASGERAQGDHVRVRFLAPTVFQSGRETLIGIYFEPDPKWHVYWKNPGDSGAAPKFEVSAKNAKTGPLQWPVPIRLPVAHLTNLGYEGSVAYLFSVLPEQDGPLQIRAKLEWLVCKVECIPGFGEIELERTAGGGPAKWQDADERIVQKFTARLPSEASVPNQYIQSASLDANGSLRIKTSPDAKIVDLFPIDGNFISPAQPNRTSEAEFVFATSPAASIPKAVGFVATSERGIWELKNIPLQTSTPETRAPFALVVLLFSAFAGGFLLNLMPCVFPVISLKAFSLLKADANRRTSDCLGYAAGVLTTFAALGAIVLMLRSIGTSIGWGFQLQSPSVIFVLILLFWLMALNFLGMFEFGTGIMNLAGRMGNNGSSFATGVLSVFIAAPCTGPFMGTALGAATTLPALSALAIFVFLGVGLAAPFLLFAAFPRTLSLLPKPGAWMETLKQFFAFPLFATVVWLLWVLGQQKGIDGWFIGVSALLLVAFAIWLTHRFGHVGRYLIVFITCALLALFATNLSTIVPQETQTTSTEWIPYDETKLADARAAGKPVFVDFTAAWCITCQVNKQTVLETEAGLAAFRAQDVLLMRADWTRYDQTITAALAKLGRNSVPVYAFYPADGAPPRLLPQLLTHSMIENLNSQR